MEEKLRGFMNSQCNRFAKNGTNTNTANNIYLTLSNKNSANNTGFTVIIDTAITNKAHRE